METYNKEKLSLKELAGYLPYGLKVVDTSQENHLFDLNEWIFRQHQHVQPYFKNHLDQILNDESLKLCLRPLSDLTKDEYFDLYLELCEELEVARCEHLILALENKNYYVLELAKWNIVEDFMYKNHFDWKYNLIGRGLAININDLLNE